MHRKEADVVHTPCLWENTKPRRPCFAQREWKNTVVRDPRGKGRKENNPEDSERGILVNTSELGGPGGREGEKGRADQIFFLLEM